MQGYGTLLLAVRAGCLGVKWQILIESTKSHGQIGRASALIIADVILRVKGRATLKKLWVQLYFVFLIPS